MTKKEYNEKFQELSQKYWRIDLPNLVQEFNNLSANGNITKSEQDNYDNIGGIINLWNKEVNEMFLIYRKLKNEGMDGIEDPTRYVIQPNRD